jgi:hypothetical protein
MEVIIANKTVVFGFLFALSEVLALIPALKANSVFEMVVGLLKKVAGK